MITQSDLIKIARARLADAKALLRQRRYDGAVYLCGYSIEIALKARICKTLRWTDFPETSREFAPYQSFKTHNLDVLLKLSGQSDRITSTYLTEWSLVKTWDPESRYKSPGTATPSDANDMIEAARILLKVLL